MGSGFIANLGSVLVEPALAFNAERMGCCCFGWAEKSAILVEGESRSLISRRRVSIFIRQTSREARPSIADLGGSYTCIQAKSAASRREDEKRNIHFGFEANLRAVRRRIVQTCF